MNLHAKMNVDKARSAFVVFFFFPCVVRSLLEIKNATNNKKMLYTIEKFRHCNATHSMNTASKVKVNNDVKKILADRIRIFCLVIVQQPYKENKTASIKGTWGKRCNQLMFMSPGKAEKSSTEFALEQVYEKHRKVADWFIMTDDNTYVIVENLRNMLSGYEKENVTYFSLAHKSEDEYSKANFTGYVLSRRALRRFKKFNRDFCNKESNKDEDNIGSCLKTLKAKEQDSRDSLHRERFFPFMPEDTLFPNKSVLSTEAAYHISDKIFECCSNAAVSFHQVKPNDMHVLDYLIYRLKPYNQGSNASSVMESSKSDNSIKKVRILCWILTCPKYHLSRSIHVKNTWGKRCDKLLFMSTANDTWLPSINLAVIDGRERLWSKTKAAFKYVYEHHRTEADWFMKADDDTYVVVDNLRYMLSRYNSSEALYLGFKFTKDKVEFMSGGAGYVLSRAALDRFVNVALSNPDTNDTDSRNEDQQMGKWIKLIGVKAVDTRDSKKLERFFPLTPHLHLFPNRSRRGYTWYWNLRPNPAAHGLNCCSNQAISFHKLRAQAMYALEYLLYYLKRSNVIL